MKVFGYCRVSTTEQVNGGLSKREDTQSRHEQLSQVGSILVRITLERRHPLRFRADLPEVHQAPRTPSPGGSWVSPALDACGLSGVACGEWGSVVLRRLILWLILEDPRRTVQPQVWRRGASIKLAI
jgi:hypothetical protein